MRPLSLVGVTLLSESGVANCSFESIFRSDRCRLILPSLFWDMIVSIRAMVGFAILISSVKLPICVVSLALDRWCLIETALLKVVLWYVLADLGVWWWSCFVTLTEEARLGQAGLTCCGWMLSDRRIVWLVSSKCGIWSEWAPTINGDWGWS